MSKYLRNPYGFCGPYAIYNALVWNNQSPCLEYLIIRCRTRLHNGTYTTEMQRVLYENFRIHIKIESDAEVIKKKIKTHGVILGYYDNPRSHWAFFYTVNDRIYGVSDGKDKKLVSYIPDKLFNHYLTKYYTSTGLLSHPQAWFIPKVEKSKD